MKAHRGDRRRSDAVDLGLPGRDGIALAREIEALADSPRIVILTVHEHNDEVVGPARPHIA